ncbi:MAG: tetratricopeptide repeat protein [Thiotrichales bacterium]|nr:tetratricopeptide repeat protein [Thiotrichales bacterium]
MSLLMDALKKAEQEKKEAARQLKQTGPNPIADTDEHRAAPGNLEDTGPHDMTISQEMDLSLEPITSGAAEAGAPATPDFTDEMPVIDNTSELDLSAEVPEADADVSSSQPIENTHEMSTELPTALDRGGELSIDNTLDEGIEEDEALISPFDDDYGFDETLDSVTASQLMDDIGGGIDQPTPVAAGTVFEAGRTNTWAIGSRLVMLGVCVVIILVAGGVLIHYQTTPVARDIPKPMALPDEILAQQAALASLPKPQLQPEPELADPAQLTAGAVTQGEVSDIEPAVAEPELAAVAQDSDVIGAVAESEVARTEPAAETATVTEPEAAAIPPSDAVIAMREDTSIMDAEIVDDFEPIVPVRPVTSETIKISRSRSSNTHNQTNMQAYQAYQSGDLDRAESLYKTTLGKLPENRDALLGLAAIKLQQDDRAAAFLIYRKLLQLNPKDRAAVLALMHIRGQGDAVNRESLLKIMLAEKPDSPQLYFSLGTLYANQLKWADAQRAFFEAYSLDNDNPDYALNLAISLDHMGQTGAARDYYQRAVDLTDTRPASFTATEVLNRIKAISQAQRS